MTSNQKHITYIIIGLSLFGLFILKYDHDVLKWVIGLPCLWMLGKGGYYFDKKSGLAR